ncbi:hypothetical protein [Rhodococcus rhodochrous]|uniref:hypothetical protein n=1 Tax=Rhodococcus rhodochrous TaxID=1829 RepID=UPI001E2F6CD7|nr:hypothetical protein [Rhodococcus rhodochrous]MCD2121207.1 hypothetical protein [Rhodococcus rhodochrous]MCQ4137300.1 hypothetical protein [Rhodococcus rhodochrous]MDJ0021207.1 hypothetical protein [Rhodococcus rhodochrous]
MSDEPNLAALIADRKGTRSYEKISQDCGGLPTAKRVHQLATQPQKNFPDPDTIRGLARGLGVPVTEVVMAAARTVNLPVYTGNDPSALSIGGAGALDDSAKEALTTVAREFIRLTFQREDGDHHGAGAEEEQEPRTQAGGPEHSSEARGDRRRPGASMTRTKVTRLTRRNQDPELDASEHATFSDDSGRMPPPDQLREDQILAARTTDDISGMYPEDTDE